MTPAKPRFPDITVQLTGENGNTLALVGIVRRAMKRSGVSANLIARYTSEALAGDYQHFLAVCQKWVEVI